MPDPYDHVAFYTEGEPWKGPAEDFDTGLRCWCGTEVVATLNDPDVRSGWAHVGVGDADDPTGRRAS